MTQFNKNANGVIRFLFYKATKVHKLHGPTFFFFVFENKAIIYLLMETFPKNTDGECQLETNTSPAKNANNYKRINKQPQNF